MNETKSLNELRDEVHQINDKWWRDLKTGERIQRHPKELLMLVVTELSECLEGVRKNLLDDKLKHRFMEEVEMADAYIRLLDIAGGFDFELVYIPNENMCNENKPQAIFDITCGVTVFFMSNGEEVSMSGLLAMIRDYCIKHKWDLDGAVREKLEYNKIRLDHTVEARKADGGKKF